MKKRIAIFLLAAAMLMLAACGSKTPAAPAIIDTQPETQATQPTETQPPQTQPTEAPTQPAAPLEYTGFYWRTWNEEMGGFSAVRNAYYVLNADHTGYVIAQEVGKITWTESQVKDSLGLTYKIALTQGNGAVNLLVYDIQSSPSVYIKIAKLPAEIQAMITEAAKPTPAPVPTTAPTVAPRITAPVITKNPTTETVTEGGDAYFVARADNYNYVNWYIVSADRSNRMPINNTLWNFPGLSYTGEGTTTLHLTNIPLTMNGWCVEAVFTGDGGAATTGLCFIYVNKAPKVSISVLPSSGIYVSDKPVQVTAAPGSFINYELYDDVGNKTTGTIQSGSYVNIPLIANCRYVARLVAYVVGDESNLIVCEYTMDGISEPVPTEPRIPSGYFTNNEAEVTITPTEGNSAQINVSILRLCNLDGYGSYSDGIYYISLENDMNATFHVGSGTLTITHSTWELLPEGTVFTGIY